LFIWQIWLLLAQSTNSNNKDIVTLDIINPKTDNKHKTPNQNQKYLKLNTHKNPQNSVNPKTHSKEYQTAFPKIKQVNQNSVQSQ